MSITSLDERSEAACCARELSNTFAVIAAALEEPERDIPPALTEQVEVAVREFLGGIRALSPTTRSSDKGLRSE